MPWARITGRLRLPAAAMRPGNDLQQVAVEVFEVQAPAAVTIAERTDLGLVRICPVGQVLFAGAPMRASNSSSPTRNAECWT
jgi:hypothetical protein